MSNIGLSFDFKEVNSMLRNKSLSELKESLSYLLLNYAELIEDKNIHEFIADISTLRFVFDMLASIDAIFKLFDHYRSDVVDLSRSYNKQFDEVLKIKRDIRELKEAKLPVKATMIPLKGGKYGK